MRLEPFTSAGKHLVVVADDFGRSSSINRAIADAHDRGIVTAASLMAVGEAFEEAVLMARERRSLSVGLHLTLCDGRSLLPHSTIPELVSVDGHFEKKPAKAWLKIRPSLLRQIEQEIKMQFNRIEESGIRPTHVDGHHHLHMHPLIFKILCRQASERGVRWIRIPKEPLSLILALRSRSRGMAPLLEWSVFGMLSAYNRAVARSYGLLIARRTYGLSATGSLNEKRLLQILDRLVISVNELFSHPDMSTEAGMRELGALTSIRVRERLASLGVDLASYRELSEGATNFRSVWGRV
ncbi:MAG: ChbG/HpnK family deacetylase [Dissulfurispiraceae bacterium]